MALTEHEWVLGSVVFAFLCVVFLAVRLAPRLRHDQNSFFVVLYVFTLAFMHAIVVLFPPPPNTSDASAISSILTPAFAIEVGDRLS
jgi:hypothetical protein